MFSIRWWRWVHVWQISATSARNFAQSHLFVYTAAKYYNESRHRQINCRDRFSTVIIANSLFPSAYISFETTVYILNKRPSDVLPNKASPYFMLFGQQPDYSLHRVFGCKCFPCLRDTLRINLHQGHYLGCLLGMFLHMRDTIVIILCPRSFFISRHVIFYEDVCIPVSGSSTGSIFS